MKRESKETLILDFYEKAIHEKMNGNQEADKFLVAVGTFCKFHINTQETMKMNINRLNKELSDNPRPSLILNVTRKVYDRKVHAIGGDRYIWKEEKVEREFTFHDAVMSVIYKTAFYDKHQWRSQKMKDYWDSKKKDGYVEELINNIAANNWTIGEARNHLSDKQFWLVDWFLSVNEIDEKIIFRQERKVRSDSTRSIESLKEKLSRGEKLSQADRNWLHQHKLSALNLK